MINTKILTYNRNNLRCFGTPKFFEGEERHLRDHWDVIMTRLKTRQPQRYNLILFNCCKIDTLDIPVQPCPCQSNAAQKHVNRRSCAQGKIPKTDTRLLGHQICASPLRYSKLPLKENIPIQNPSAGRGFSFSIPLSMKFEIRKLQKDLHDIVEKSKQVAEQCIKHGKNQETKPANKNVYFNMCVEVH